jgi:probable rRNA maturation factor
MAVTIQNSQTIPFQTAKLRQAALNALRAECAGGAEVSILLTDDETIHELNRDYRGYDKPTDVLSFAQRESREPRAAADRTPNTEYLRLTTRSKIQTPKSKRQNVPELLGDIVISVETAARQADTHGMTLDEELALLVTHGILHLLGYDDVSQKGMEEMEARERFLGVRP